MSDDCDHSVRIASLDEELDFHNACPRLATRARAHERCRAARPRARESPEPANSRGPGSRQRSMESQESSISGKKLRFENFREFDLGERSGGAPFVPRVEARRQRDDAWRFRYVDGSSEGSNGDEVDSERENLSPTDELKRMSARGRDRGEKLLHLSPIRESNKRATSATYAEIRALQARHNDILNSMGTLLSKLQALQLKN